jgi:hypothetical protein
LEQFNQLPAASVLNHDSGIYDFVECYKIKVMNNGLGLNELIALFFQSIPNWFIGFLNFKINTKKVDGPKRDYSEGDMIGPFHLFRLSNNEVIFGINKKPIDYRISLLIEGTNSYILCFSTAFTINNFWGRCHFTLLKPIYRLASLRILQTLIRHL